VKIGLAGDHGGFELKGVIAQALRSQGHEVVDFGPPSLVPTDDFPLYVVPLARAVVRGQVERGIAICGSGVGASIAANKVPGARAALVHDAFSAHQGVEDDDMNVLCLGGRVVGTSLALELVKAFLGARFTEGDRFRRRLEQIAQVEHER
jgi:ribose 5-phosphate isomerase B